MATKKKTTKRKQKDRNAIVADARPDDERGDAIARTTMRPTVQAALTLKDFGTKFGELDLTALVNALSEQTLAANNGDLGRAEAMLTAQAHSLDAIYNNLAQRAALNAGEYLGSLRNLPQVGASSPIAMSGYAGSVYRR